MILSEQEDLDTWLDFVTLCRNGGNNSLAERILSISQQLPQSAAHQSPSLGPGKQPPFSPSLRGDSSPNNPLDDQRMVMERRIRFAMLKQQWDKGDRANALFGLDHLVRSTRLITSSSNPSSSAMVPMMQQTSSQVDSSYLSCLLKLGEWKISILDPSKPVDLPTRMEVLQLYSRATLVDPNSYRASHQWGLCNYRAIEEIRAANKSFVYQLTNSTAASPRSAHRQHSHQPASHISTQGPPSAATITRDQFVAFAVNSIKGLMKALTLGSRKFSSSVMQDMLCLLSLWFRYGRIPEIHNALETGLSTVAIDNWLGVLPQLIARIDHPEKGARTLLHSLLMRLGSKHAQALVYPLSVALKSQKGDRKEAAESLMNGLRQNSPRLIDQALLVSEELVRVAISWEESWHWGLEEASRQCFGEGNLLAMIETLEPLHELMNRGPTTLREAAFVEAYKYELTRAFECLQAYKAAMAEKHLPIPTKKPTLSRHALHGQAPPPPEESHITQAWDFYYPVFKRINSQLPHINTLDLSACSPQLHNAINFDLGVPGTYQVNGSAVKIRSFHQTIAIIRSKQRPRRLRIIGENAQEFVFLLKVRQF